MTEAIVASDLVKTYPPDVRALDGLSISVSAGTVFGLLGPNGAGKSTTVRILTALSRPDSGTARVAGIDVLADPQRARHVIGVVGQKHGVDPNATARENMVLQGEFYGLSGRGLRAESAETLERLDLADVADRRVKTYSGGMQRRLDVAMGLIHRPQVLFLDEPTTGLDPEVRAGMWAEIERLAREERDDDPADHPLPRGGRQAREPGGDRRPRQGRGQRHARGAQARASGRHDRDRDR